MKFNETYWMTVKSQYPIEPGVIYMNNGSFGPCPAPVLDVSTNCYKTLETNPQRYLGEYHSLVVDAKGLLADFVGADPGELVFITNVTVGMNMIAHGLDFLRSGDEIVTTSQEYGAVRNVWDFRAGKRGMNVVTVDLPTPPISASDITDRILNACTSKTKVIVMSHITSPTGMILPVAEICKRASERGILTAIDGAHAPGMIPLDVHAIGCDFYTGNCHKWLGSPKGAGFFYARADRHDMLDPFIVGWGWKQDEETFIGNFENPGTHNLAMFVGVGEAVRFQKSIGVEAIRMRGFELASYLRQKLEEIPGAKLHTSTSIELSGSMTTVELANHTAETLRAAFSERNFVLPGIGGDHPRFRISTHIYNTFEEIDQLLDIVRETAEK